MRGNCSFGFGVSTSGRYSNDDMCERKSGWIEDTERRGWRERVIEVLRKIGTAKITVIAWNDEFSVSRDAQTRG